MDTLKFPLGKFKMPETVSAEERTSYINTIEQFPELIRAATSELSDEDLEKIYRPGGWNVRQLVHHCADSHMNAFIRFKIGLTEEDPTIRPYNQAAWSELPDNLEQHVATSLAIIYGVHARWTYLLKSMDSEDFQRYYIHPQQGIAFGLDQALANYDWHCRHHLEHIRIALSS